MSTVNRLLGLLLGLVLVGVGVVAVVEAIVAAIDRPGWILDRRRWDELLSGLAWDDTGLMVTAAILLLAGAALVVAQLVPGTPSAVPMEVTTPDRQAAFEGRAVQELLRRRAVEDDDVVAATVRLRRRTARVSVAVPPDADSTAVRDRMRERLRGRIDELELQKPLRLKVGVERAKERVR